MPVQRDDSIQVVNTEEYVSRRSIASVNGRTMLSLIGIIVFAIFYYRIGSRFGKGSTIAGILLAIVSIVFWIAGEYAVERLTNMPLAFTAGALAQVLLFITITLYRMIRNRPLSHDRA